MAWLLYLACTNVRYTKNDMEVLKNLFARHDADKSGSLDIVS